MMLYSAFNNPTTTYSQIKTIFVSNLDYQFNGGIDIDANGAEVNLCTTDSNASTPSSEIINSKNGISHIAEF